MDEQSPSEKLLRYELLLREISRKVAEQRALEAHQLRNYHLPFRMIEFGRADTYCKIARLVQAFEGTE